MRFVIAALFTLIFTAALAGDFEDGVAAYDRKDYASALVKFRSAAQQGNRDAASLVGMMYNEGTGVLQDYKEAVHWFQIAALQGDRSAQLGLGFMYGKGQGVAQDYKEAVRWFRLAAKQGDARAQHNLCVMYLKGQGVLQDYARAHMWSNIAAGNGYETAAKMREFLASMMTAQQIEQAQRMARECMSSNFTKCD